MTAIATKEKPPQTTTIYATKAIPHIVVIGGGVCGLYAARQLAKAGIRVTIIEKESTVGGLATSRKLNGNYYDYGSHMLHAFDREIFDDLVEIMGEERISVESNAKIRWNNSFYRYPLQFIDILKGMPLWTFLKCIIGLLYTQVTNHFRAQEPKNAEEALIQLYGKPLYKFFFKEFTHRYWGIPPTKLSATFIKTKMPRLSAVDYIKKILAKFGIKDKTKSVESPLLKETLYYSRTGAETLPRRIAARVKEEGGIIYLNAKLDKIYHENNRIIKISYVDLTTKTHHIINCDQCISTIPLPFLIKSFTPKVDKKIIATSNQLKYKPVTIFGFLVKKQKCLDALYIYYRARTFHRIAEPKNAGLIVTPADYTILIVETIYDIQKMNENEIKNAKKRVIDDLSQENICQPSDIAESYLLYLETGYPIFDLGFEPHFEKVKNFIANIENLISTGRQGAFCYPNMHKAMRMGATAAESIIQQYVGHFR